MAQVQGSREEILVSAYNEGYQYFEEYKNTTKEYYDSLKKKYEDEKLAMQILGYTDVDVAHAFEMREHGHARFRLHTRDQALAAAGNHNVDIAIEP